MAKYFLEKILKPGVLRDLIVAAVKDIEECKWQLDNPSWDTAVFRAIAL